jgi:hypothetical protein
MSRQRRRRIESVSLQDEATQYREEKQRKKKNQSEVVFMEEMDYKMEVED